jgi:hypothetical protein
LSAIYGGKKWFFSSLLAFYIASQKPHPHASNPHPNGLGPLRRHFLSGAENKEKKLKNKKKKKKSDSNHFGKA